MTAEVVSSLRQALGDKVSVEPDVLSQAQSDKSGQKTAAAPLCVVFPTTTDDVSRVLAIAHSTNTPVVTRGGGSGLAGGAMGGAGEIVVNLTGMNRILDISVEDRLAVVEAGVINEVLNEEAKKHGLWFAPDPASRPWSTVGGNIATNAGGLLCVKYGVTREAVRDLTVVLAGGDVIRVGHTTTKGVTGFDLASLFVGSEGTLGIITQATVALRPLDESPVWTVAGYTPDIAHAIAAVSHTMATGITPAIVELVDQKAAARIASYLERDDLPSGVVHLIAQTDGAQAGADAETIAAIWRDCGLVVDTGPDRDDLIEFRRAMHLAMEQHGQVLIEDVAVPRSKLLDMFVAIRDIEAEFGVDIPTVAHAGDGNLHPNFIYTGDDVPDHIWAAADALFRRAVALGGTLTGEHGVGVLKRQWLAEELGQRQWKLQREIKRVFDPAGVLNPGKVFSPERDPLLP